MFTRQDGINDLNNIFEDFIKIYKVVPSTNHKYLNLNVPLMRIFSILLLIQILMVTKLIIK